MIQLCITSLLILASDPTAACLARVNSVHDGDTLVVDIVLPFDVVLPNQQIRAFGYDAWEVSRIRQTVGIITDEELKKGATARDALKELINSGTLYVEDVPKKDPYGRTLAKLRLKKSDNTWLYIPEWMEDNGHCRNLR